MYITPVFLSRSQGLRGLCHSRVFHNHMSLSECHLTLQSTCDNNRAYILLVMCLFLYKGDEVCLQWAILNPTTFALQVQTSEKWP